MDTHVAITALPRCQEDNQKFPTALTQDEREDERTISPSPKTSTVALHQGGASAYIHDRLPRGVSLIEYARRAEEKTKFSP